MCNVVESGIHCVSRCLARLLSFRHLFDAVVSAAIGVTDMAGEVEVPLKWDQSSLASTVTWKQKEKMAQFIPLTSSLGTFDGRVLVVIGMAVDILMNSELIFYLVFFSFDQSGLITCDC